MRHNAAGFFPCLLRSSGEPTHNSTTIGCAEIRRRGTTRCAWTLLIGKRAHRNSFNPAPGEGGWNVSRHPKAAAPSAPGCAERYATNPPVSESAGLEVQVAALAGGDAQNTLALRSDHHCRFRCAAAAKHPGR